MYLRFSQRANADGTLVRYVALAHNRRVDGKAKPDVLMNLGRVDRLAAGRAVDPAGDRHLDQADHRWPAVHHGGRAGAVRAGL
jgi:hypothetical protein